MPIYEYICFDCGKNFEAIRLMKEADTPIVCDKCHSDHTGRKLAVLFASSGGSKAAAGGGGGCASCGGGSCASCGH